MIAWVLADNPSRRFYEKLGGDRVQTRDIIVGGKQFKEYGYGWKNLDSLVSATKSKAFPSGNAKLLLRKQLGQQ